MKSIEALKAVELINILQIDHDRIMSDSILKRSFAILQVQVLENTTFITCIGILCDDCIFLSKSSDVKKLCIKSMLQKHKCSLEEFKNAVFIYRNIYKGIDV